MASTIAAHYTYRYRVRRTGAVARASLTQAANTTIFYTMNLPITGYAEGFYGRLLSWSERRQILDTLQRLGYTTYYYAPKEDPCHRLHWRTPYDEPWRQAFRSFCEYAHDAGIRVVAGVAPGLDFDFSDFPDNQDFASLVAKSKVLLDDGADVISLLMDDIDADFEKRSGSFHAEGEAHAALANALGHALSDSIGNADSKNLSAVSVWVTPRIYADELIADAENYLPAFIVTLEKHHCVLYCGSDVVAHTLDADSANTLRATSGSSGGLALKHRVIIWDNLYANDYCPRRLFIGPWQRRKALDDILLNPTGLVYTDCMLLEMMSVGRQQPAGLESDPHVDDASWQAVLRRHGVPDVFLEIAPFLYHPHFNVADNTAREYDDCVDNDAIASAMEYCLWCWKTPLSREWYAFIFGLKHDLLTLAGEHPCDRILKTQTQPMARVLLTRHEKHE